VGLTKEEVIEKITARYGESVRLDGDSLDLPAVIIDSKKAHDLIRFMRDELEFNFMTDMCGAHFPDNAPEAQFATIYHMHNWMTGVRVRIKAFLNAENPSIETMSDLYLSANWQERETYDFYGIDFKGHPDLRRILNMDEMESFPMRKEFPLEDQGRTDKDDRYFGREPQTNNVPNNELA
jgi:NADH-quinone oxidoreductase subunit C